INNAASQTSAGPQGPQLLEGECQRRNNLHSSWSVLPERGQAGFIRYSSLMPLSLRPQRKRGILIYTSIADSTGTDGTFPVVVKGQWARLRPHILLRRKRGNVSLPLSRQPK